MPVGEYWVTKKDMAEQLKRAKINRKTKLGPFTRKHNHVKALIDGGAEGEVLEKQYEELSEVFKEVEKSHQDLCMLLEEDDDEADDSYLDDPSSKLSTIHVSISKAITAAKVAATVASENASNRRKSFREVWYHSKLVLRASVVLLRICLNLVQRSLSAVRI